MANTRPHRRDRRVATINTPGGQVTNLTVVNCTQTASSNVITAQVVLPSASNQIGGSIDVEIIGGEIPTDTVTGIWGGFGQLAPDSIMANPDGSIDFTFPAPQAGILNVIIAPWLAQLRGVDGSACGGCVSRITLA